MIDCNRGGSFSGGGKPEGGGPRGLSESLPDIMRFINEVVDDSEPRKDFPPGL